VCAAVSSVKKLKYQSTCAAVVGIDEATGDGAAVGALLAAAEADAEGVAAGDDPVFGAGVMLGQGCATPLGLSNCARAKMS
jgi:hypothetical protein